MSSILKSSTISSQRPTTPSPSGTFSSPASQRSACVRPSTAFSVRTPSATATPSTPMSLGFSQSRGPLSIALTICLWPACSAIRPILSLCWKLPRYLTCGGRATTVLFISTAPTCFASEAFGYPGAQTMFPSSAPSSNALLLQSMWRCPPAQCQAP